MSKTNLRKVYLDFDIGQKIGVVLQIVLCLTKMMIKRSLLLGTLLLSASCTKRSDILFGKWEVDSRFYRATYSIERNNSTIKARTIYYNDDTTILEENKSNPIYLFTNLKWKNDSFIDAVSGATKAQKDITSIKVKHRDTLIVTTYIMNKPIQELWIRKTDQH